MPLQSYTSIEPRVESHIPVFRKTQTQTEIFERLQSESFSYVDHIFFVDEEETLTSVLPVHALFADTKEEDQHITEFPTMRIDEDQEYAVLRALEAGWDFVAVVDDEQRPKGVVESSRLMDILYEEFREDIYRSVGMLEAEDEMADTAGSSVLAALKNRVPWLIVGLGGGVVAAWISLQFESALQRYMVLSAFVPLMVYMSDAVATQTQTLYIRRLVTEMDQRSYLAREAKTSCFIALIIGVLLGILSLPFVPSLIFSVTLGISLVITIFLAVIISLSIPFALHRMNIDPAFGSGPFATIIADITSLLIYFTIATTMLDWAT